MDGDTTERLSQESQCPDAKEHGLLARASAFAGGVLSSIQALVGTTACKGVQIARLKDWAIKNVCRITQEHKGKDVIFTSLPLTFIE